MGAVGDDDVTHLGRQHRGALVDEVDLRSELSQFLDGHLGLCFQHRRIALKFVEEQMEGTDGLARLVGEASFFECCYHFPHDESGEEVVSF